MKFLEALSNSATVQKMAKTIDKNSPKICLVFGVISVVGGVGTAVWGTVKAVPKIDELKAKRQEIKDFVPEKNEEYTDKQRSKDLTHVYTRAAWDIGKYYIPTVVLTGAGIFLLGKGYSIQNTRLVGATAALNMTQAAFNNYRAEVEKRYGAETDMDIMKKNAEARQNNVPNRKPSTNVGEDYFGRYLTPSNSIWDRNTNILRMTVIAQKNTLQNLLDNNILKSHVTVNEIYHKLGFKEVHEGLVYGWEKGDDIDVFIEETYIPNAINDQEPCLKLSFNCHKLYS